jgi:hypothetical protein
MTEMLVPDPPAEAPAATEGAPVSADQTVLRSLEPVAPTTGSEVSPLPLDASDITALEAATVPILAPAPLEDGLLAGRPVEDRAFEVVEGSVGLAAGALIGGVIAGPIGAAIGGMIGVAGGVVAGEALERHEGHAAETTDADPADEPWTEHETLD